MKIIDEILDKQFILKKRKYTQLGLIKKFDDKFYRQFDGMYFQGLPIYYHLADHMTNGRCYDGSATLGLALGEGAFICRGDLKSQSKAWGKGKLGHGWVEMDGICYDTTWKIACPQKIYYKVFKPVKVFKRSYAKFFDDCKDLTDWTIRDKVWYENNYSSALLLIFLVRYGAETELKEPNLTKERREFLQKLLTDLPDEYKAERPDIMKCFTRKQEAVQN